MPPWIDDFAEDLDAVVQAARSRMGKRDVAHLRQFERVSVTCAVLGLSIAWLPPWGTIFGAFLLALGRGSRWILMHHISHGGYDAVPQVPPRYTSEVFAKGWRRLVDWPDWMLPSAWRLEHNVLHHAFTSEDKDPDLVENVLAPLRRARLPRTLKISIVLLLASLWRPLYYAPRTAMCLHRRSLQHAKPLGPAFVLNLLLGCYAFYVLLHFVLLPLAFTPLGTTAVVSMFCASLIADVLCNLHTAAMIVPNHAGDNLYRYDKRAGSRSAHYLRQVMCSANMPCGTDVLDFFHLYLNYQIEHHLWPKLPMLQYRLIQPEVRAICRRYGVPYVQENVWVRVRKAMAIAVGDASMRPWTPNVFEPTRVVQPPPVA